MPVDFLLYGLILLLRGKTLGGGESMKNALGILLLAAVLGLTACAAGTPDHDNRYDRTRGYPEDYFNNRPDYYYSAPSAPDPAEMENR
jgi:hypothetical protein